MSFTADAAALDRDDLVDLAVDMEAVVNYIFDLVGMLNAPLKITDLRVLRALVAGRDRLLEAAGLEPRDGTVERDVFEPGYERGREWLKADSASLVRLMVRSFPIAQMTDDKEEGSLAC